MKFQKTLVYETTKNSAIKEFYNDIGYRHEKYYYNGWGICNICKKLLEYSGERGRKIKYTIEKEEFICKPCAHELHAIYVPIQKRYEQFFKNRLQITDEELQLLKEQLIQKIGEFNEKI